MEKIGKRLRLAGGRQADTGKHGGDIRRSAVQDKPL